MIVVNGKEREGYEEMSILSVLEQEGYELRRIALEINGEIIPKADFNQTIVHSGDHIEVVSFVGGG